LVVPKLAKVSRSKQESTDAPTKVHQIPTDLFTVIVMMIIITDSIASVVPRKGVPGCRHLASLIDEKVLSGQTPHGGSIELITILHQLHQISDGRRILVVRMSTNLPVHTLRVYIEYDNGCIRVSFVRQWTYIPRQGTEIVEAMQYYALVGEYVLQVGQ
jgi:hypothetical protein